MKHLARGSVWRNRYGYRKLVYKMSCCSGYISVLTEIESLHNFSLILNKSCLILFQLRNTKINIFLQTSEKLLEQEVDIFRAIISSHGDCLNALQEPMEKVSLVSACLFLLYYFMIGESCGIADGHAFVNQHINYTFPKHI